MSAPLAAVIAANRFGLGARPGDLEMIGRDPRGWLRFQLQGLAPQPAGVLPASSHVLAQALALRKEIRAVRRQDTATPTDTVQGLLRPVYQAEVLARFRLAIATERPFLERLTQFWSNHFAVSVDKGLVAGLAGALEREAIRPHVLGTFRELLLAVECHPAMLVYLDNHVSTGPHSPAALRARAHTGHQPGLNENLAREILELHTLGVGGGYTQQDVTTFAAVLTGWSVGRPDSREREAAGSFLFREVLHEPGAKTLLGRRHPEGGFEQGVAVLEDLVRHPATARHLATKLVRHFVADDPPPAAVERVAYTYMASGGYLPAVYQALLQSPEAWESGLTKFKTPADYLISTYRGLQLPAAADKAVLGAFEQLGQRNFNPGSPAGWPDRSEDWDGASALLKRIEWADKVAQRLGSECDAQTLGPQLLGANLSESTRSAIAHAAHPAQALTLLLASPEFMRR